MDQDTLVNEQIESGKRLIDALPPSGFEVRTAFWAKPTEEGKWYLYLSSPVVDEKGQRTAYGQVFDVMRNLPDLWIEPLEIRVVGVGDSVASAAEALTRPKVPNGPFAVRNPKPYPGMTRYGGSTLGGVSVDGVAIYPPPEPATAV